MLTDKVTIVIPTSVIPSHPSTHILDWCVSSVLSHFPKSPVRIMMDGVREEQSHRAADYEEFKARLRFPESCDVERIEFPLYRHQAAMLIETLPKIGTELLLFIEHDWLLLEPIPWKEMIQTLVDGDADVIRLHQEPFIHPEHMHLMGEKKILNGISLRQQKVFWCQPHLARVDWYRRVLEENFSPVCRTMIEDRIYGINLSSPWELNKIWMYEPEGDMKRVKHTDGRGKNPDGSPAVPKWDERFVP